MIAELFIFVISGLILVIRAPFELFPVSTTLVNSMSDSVVFVIENSYRWNWILPVVESIQILRWWLYVNLGVILWITAKWVLGWIRGSGGGGN